MLWATRCNVTQRHGSHRNAACALLLLKPLASKAVAALPVLALPSASSYIQPPLLAALPASCDAQRSFSNKGLPSYLVMCPGQARLVASQWLDQRY